MKKQVYVYLTEPKNPDCESSYTINTYAIGEHHLPTGWQFVEGEHFVDFDEILPAPAAEQAIQDLKKQLGKLEAQATQIKREIASFLAITNEVYHEHRI